MHSSLLFHCRNFFQGIKLTSKLALAMIFSFLNLLSLIGGTGCVIAFSLLLYPIVYVLLNLLLMLNGQPINMLPLWANILNWRTAFVARTTAIINHIRNQPVQSMITFYAALLIMLIMPILLPCYLIKLSVQEFVTGTRNYYLANLRAMPLELALLSSFIGFSTLIFYPFTIAASFLAASFLAASFLAASFILGKLIGPGERQMFSRREYKNNELKLYAETALIDYRSHKKPNHYFNSYSLLFYAFYIKKDLNLVKELIQTGANIHAPIAVHHPIYDYFHQFMYRNNHKQDVFYRASKLTFAELVIRLAIKKEARPKENSTTQKFHLDTLQFLIKTQKDSFTFREPALPVLHDSQIIERCLVQNTPLTADYLLQTLNINGLPSTPNLVTDYDNKVMTCPKWQETAVNHHHNLSIFRLNNANIANKNSLFSLAAKATIHLAKKGIKGNQNPDLLEYETQVITRYKRFPVLFPLSQTQQDTVNLYNHLNSIANTMRRH